MMLQFEENVYLFALRYPSSSRDKEGAGVLLGETEQGFSTFVAPITRRYGRRRVALAGQAALRLGVKSLGNELMSDGNLKYFGVLYEPPTIDPEVGIDMEVLKINHLFVLELKATKETDLSSKYRHIDLDHYRFYYRDLPSNDFVSDAANTIRLQFNNEFLDIG